MGFLRIAPRKGTFVAEVNSEGFEVANAKSAIDLLVDNFLEQAQELGLSQTDAAEAVAKRAGGMFV